MKVRVFTLPYDPCAQHFDDMELRRFIDAGAEAIEVREHFFECDGHPVWALLVTYRDTVDAEPIAPRRGVLRVGDAQQELSSDELVRFEAVRAWRNARAGRDGKPPYILLTNRQLAVVAKRNPGSLTDLGEIQGIGDGKLQDFGAELIEVLMAARSQPPLQKNPPGDTVAGARAERYTQGPHADQ